MKTPPDRSGIAFEVGGQLEARDRQKNWYTATIEKIDFDQERVLVHYRQWSRRHDEWFHWSSPYLRPLERVSLRRRGLNPPCSQAMFVSGTKVLACWTDCRFYPAKILRVNKDESYTVRFYDGVVRTVKPTKVKPFQEKSKSEKSAVGSEGWEEGESEEDDAGREEEKEEGETEGAEEEDQEGEASSSRPPAKKPADDGSSRAHRGPITAAAQPAACDSGHAGRDVLLERQAHLPTTHKFSREPLYRVIKNQPPPILSIELDHNPFKCPAGGCGKSFRKASLLHYHIKYYHSDQRLDEQETPRRKRSTSEGGDPGSSDRKRENQGVLGHRDDTERGAAPAEGRKDGARDRTGGLNRKERKNFLRVKLKKKKKKKKKRRSQSGLCSSDDENSERPPVTLKLSPGDGHQAAADDGSDWSTLTAESGEEASSWPVAMETEDCEVVRCVCEADEENDFMIQCESCLCWQHGTCMGLYEDNVPHNYICYYCRHSAGWRRARRRLRPEPDWLVSGRMFGLSCVADNYSEVNAAKIAHTGHLMAHTQGLNQVLGGLQLKISLLRAPSHPDLQLWRSPWRWDEGSQWTSGPPGEPAACYVRSEHCYQRPGALWEKEAAARPEDRRAPTGGACAHTGSGATQTRCQLNLLQHVESLHRQIGARMELVERELDVLESWLDHSGELEPPDPLSRLPQLKQRIRRLLRDLGTVRRLSACR